jgi:hypothetical protein
VNPLSDLAIDIQSYDIRRTASVYSDVPGERWWTKSWFNGREKGEMPVEIGREMALAFIRGEIDLDTWLSRYYPKQMNIYRQAMSTTRSQLLL